MFTYDLEKIEYRTKQFMITKEQKIISQDLTLMSFGSKKDLSVIILKKQIKKSS